MRFFALCLCFLFSGCSFLSSLTGQDGEYVGTTRQPEPELPIPAMFPITSQFRLEAGKHWQTIAEDAARALIPKMRGQRCLPGTPCRSLYVVAPENETNFSRAFTNALITALVSQGITVSNAPDAALALHVDVQSLKFGYGDKLEDDQKVRPLMPNLWASAQESQEKPLKLAHLFPSRAAHCEIFVTLSVLDGQRYIARASQVYYVSADDLRLYEQRICSRLRPCEGGATEGNSEVAPAKKGTLSIIGEANEQNAPMPVPTPAPAPAPTPAPTQTSPEK